jgi:hypothetical protein
MSDPRSILGRVMANDDEGLRRMTGQVAALFDRDPVECRADVGAEVSNVRRITVQVVDRLGVEWPGIWPVRVWIATVDGGGPAGTNTLGVVTGTLVSTLISGQYIEGLTNASGVLEVDLTVTGAANRFVRAFVVGIPVQVAATTFAA